MRAQAIDFNVVFVFGILGVDIYSIITMIISVIVTKKGSRMFVISGNKIKITPAMAGFAKSAIDKARSKCEFGNVELRVKKTPVGFELILVSGRTTVKTSCKNYYLGINKLVPTFTRVVAKKKGTVIDLKQNKKARRVRSGALEPTEIKNENEKLSA